MVVGHVTDPQGLATIRKYLRWHHRTHHTKSACQQHGEIVGMQDEGEKIVFTGCCRKSVHGQLDHICKVVDWLEFYQSISVLD